MPEIEWMLKTMGPFEKYTTPEHKAKASALGVFEGLKSGTTCFGEIGTSSQVLENVYCKVGVRARVAGTINEIGPSSRHAAYELYEFDRELGEQKLEEGIEMVKRWNDSQEGRITCMLASQAVDMVGRELLLRIKEVAAERGLLVHLRIAQGKGEAVQAEKRYDKTTAQFLNHIGFLDSSVIGAHCHQTTDDEAPLPTKRGIITMSHPKT